MGCPCAAGNGGSSAVVKKTQARGGERACPSQGRAGLVVSWRKWKAAGSTTRIFSPGMGLLESRQQMVQKGPAKAEANAIAVHSVPSKANLSMV